MDRAAIDAKQAEIERLIENLNATNKIAFVTAFLTQVLVEAWQAYEEMRDDSERDALRVGDEVRERFHGALAMMGDD